VEEEMQPTTELSRQIAELDAFLATSQIPYPARQHIIDARRELYNARNRVTA
jgi:hypothetical protein